MKKVIPLAVLGKNGIFKETGCPLHNNDHAYDDYCRTLTYGHCIVVSEHMYNRLPEKSPPFPCRKVYVIMGKDGVMIEPGVTNVSVVLSVEQVVSMCSSKEKIFMLVDTISYNEMVEFHEAVIDSILVATLNEPVDGTERFELPKKFEWGATLMATPTFTISRCVRTRSHK